MVSLALVPVMNDTISYALQLKMPGLSQVSFKGLISSFSIQVVPRFLIQIKLNIDQYRALKWYGIGILFENLRYWYWDLF